MMKETTQIIGVEAIQPGMVLAEAACDARGRMLVPVETQLTMRHQRQLRQWGIEVVTVLASAPAPAASDSPAARIIEWLQIDERDPFMYALAQLTRARYERYLRETTRAKEGSRR